MHVDLVAGARVMGDGTRLQAVSAGVGRGATFRISLPLAAKAGAWNQGAGDVS